MAELSFALLAAHESGHSIEVIADRLTVPYGWVQERIEAARLCVDMEIASLPFLDPPSLGLADMA